MGSIDSSSWMIREHKKELFVNNITAACKAFVKYGEKGITNPYFFKSNVRCGETFLVVVQFGVQYNMNYPITRMTMRITERDSSNEIYFCIAECLLKSRICKMYAKMSNKYRVILSPKEDRVEIIANESKYEIEVGDILKYE